jgi:hypothetical protein
LVRNPKDRLLDKKFDVQLLTLLRDVKFLIGENREQIPPVALEIFESNEKYQ